ncbi:PREDICTED: uncharacterized protein LOC108609198 [Drosophila arizonae]|uniref:Uncharacterized protein LOC108609198 n=1 Tax=Drosophila arizonae TaxID=7263 RepID=A0ABM1NN83_DROAR|nr:PREDICTED: uncharacterized protein LOC108609198 [Drosophila arizonae]
MRVYNLLLLTFVTALASLAASGEAHIPDCTDHINGLSFADPISCSSFYVCLRGRALRRECGHGLYFDPRTQICNLPRLVECHNGDRSGSIVTGDAHDDHLAAPGGKAPCETTPKPPCTKTAPTAPPPCTKTSTPSAESPSETTTPCETTRRTTTPAEKSTKTTTIKSNNTESNNSSGINCWSSNRKDNNTESNNT